MKDNKSPAVDGIPPTLLMETVEHISILLARVFNLSLIEGIVPSEWKEANIISLFKKGSRNKHIYSFTPAWGRLLPLGVHKIAGILGVHQVAGTIGF